MKSLIKMALASLVLALGSCGIDNYDSPQSTFTGKVTYNGQALGVRGTASTVKIYLYQDNYELNDPISVYLDQEGKFTALLFDGDYKMITCPGNGPWLDNTDTIKVTVNGFTTADLPVTPYYTVSNENFNLSGNVLNASVTVTKVVQSSTISSALLLIGKTAFVDEGTYLARTTLSDVTEGNLTMSLDVSGNSSVSSATALYARLGIKANGSSQYIYTTVVKLK
jgi:hypothetical protein